MEKIGRNIVRAYMVKDLCVESCYILITTVTKYSATTRPKVDRPGEYIEGAHTKPTEHCSADEYQI